MNTLKGVCNCMYVLATTNLSLQGPIPTAELPALICSKWNNINNQTLKVVSVMNQTVFSGNIYGLQYYDGTVVYMYV